MRTLSFFFKDSGFGYLPSGFGPNLNTNLLRDSVSDSTPKPATDSNLRPNPKDSVKSNFRRENRLSVVNIYPLIQSLAILNHKSMQYNYHLEQFFPYTIVPTIAPIATLSGFGKPGGGEWKGYRAHRPVFVL